MDMEIVRSKDVLDEDVEDMQGNNLGTIKELMLDKYTGKVQYVVLASGGILGLGATLHAMPWEIFSYAKDRDCFVINIDKEKLKSAPGFDPENWPNMANPEWTSNLHNFYGISPTSHSSIHSDNIQ